MSSIMLWLYRIATWWLPESRAFGFRAMMLRLAGAKVGQNVRIYSSVMFTGVGAIEIGDDVHIGASALFVTARPATITIGSHVDIGPGAVITSGTHEIDPQGLHIAGNGLAQSVAIGDGCWIGARAVILPGVELPQSTLVAAGAVVAKSVSESHCLVAGVPAIVKKRYA